MAACKVGDRIEMLHMPEDPDPIPPGEQGTVRSVSPGLYDREQIGVVWDSGRSLSLIEGVDRYRVVGA